MAEEFIKRDYNLITGGSDNHLILIDLRNKKITGKYAQDILDTANITLNKNSVPYDTESFMETSGIRIGTPAVTTRGMKENDMVEIVNAIDMVLKDKKIDDAKKIVKSLTDKYPIYPEISM